MSKAAQHENYRDHYETPPDFFHRLNIWFSFHADLAASDSNHLLPMYFTKEDSALDAMGCYAPACDSRLKPGRFHWCNPPYGKGLKEWCDMLMWMYLSHGVYSVALLPANVDSRWFHDTVLPHASIIWIRGRVQFLIDGKRPTYIDKHGKERVSGNNGGNFLAIFGPNLLGCNSIKAKA